jgi:hypothetical protein
MNWVSFSLTVCRMDAASERTWMYLQRVMENDTPFMSFDYSILAIVGAVYVSR